MTLQRQAILDALSRPDAVEDPSWVYEEVRKVVPDISQATVLRNLSLLRQAGFIRAAETGNATERGITTLRCQLSCISCKRTVDATISVGADLEGEAASATGFVITGHRVDFYGLCPSCARQRRQG